MAKFSGKLNYGTNLPVKKDESVSRAEINLPELNIQQLYDELQGSINSGTPMFLWSRKRQNKKIELDNEKQVMIFQKIRYLRNLSDEYLRMKADIIFSEEYLGYLVDENKMKAEQYFQLMIAEHQLELTKMKSEIDLTNSLLDHDIIEKNKKRIINDGLFADNEIKLAQAEKLKAEADSLKTQNELKRIVMSKIDFDNFPPIYTAYLLSILSGVSSETFTDLDIKEKLKDVFINMEETKVKKAQAEVDDFINSAEFRKWKNDRAKKDAGL